MEKVLFYSGEWTSFDNFSAYQITTPDGRLWPTVEHAYQAAKFDDPIIIAIIYGARSAHNAKKFGRSYAAFVRPDWKEVKVKLATMEGLLRLKVAQHPHVRERLLATGDAVIIEDSPKDSFWGRGPDWKGLNHLGQLWMKLRDELRGPKSFSTEASEVLTLSQEFKPLIF